VTRITTTPPTVIRSQISELLRIRNFSSLPADIHYTANFTVAIDICSDSHHILPIRDPAASGNSRFTLQLRVTLEVS
jgi:hypothetical protein